MNLTRRGVVGGHASEVVFTFRLDFLKRVRGRREVCSRYPHLCVSIAPNVIEAVGQIQGTAGLVSEFDCLGTRNQSVPFPSNPILLAVQRRTSSGPRHR